MGTRFTFGRNGVIKIPRRNKVKNAPGDLRGAFVGEGQPIPVRRGSFGSISLTPHKMGVISDFTREMAAHSTPAIEGLIREGIIEDTADAIDTALLDAVAGDAIRPAGLLNGVTPITGTAGGGIAAMTADISAILAPFITANASDRLVFLINPSAVFKLQWASTAVGVYPFRDQVSAGNIGGIPFIQSTNIPATQLILVRYADFASAAADTPEFDVSDVATLHEDDGAYPTDQAMRTGTATVLPIVDGAGAVAKPTRSLWQTASIGIRMLLDMDWAMRRASMVQTVTGITW
jgi:HK97 family phage major capsid protein